MTPAGISTKKTKKQAVFAFRRYEDASLRYTGIESYKGLSHYWLTRTLVRPSNPKSNNSFDAEARLIYKQHLRVGCRGLRRQYPLKAHLQL